MAISAALSVARAVAYYSISSVADTASKNNIRRIVILLNALVIALMISILFANRYTAVVPLGLVSLDTWLRWPPI
jgi:hypothetical protein